MFLRGVAAGDGNDPDRNSRTAKSGGNAGDNVGSYQDNTFKSHNHPATGTVNANTFVSVPIAQAVTTGFTGGPQYSDDGASGVARAYPSATVNVSDSGGSETRPVNAYVYYIIKVK